MIIVPVTAALSVISSCDLVVQATNGRLNFSNVGTSGPTPGRVCADFKNSLPPYPVKKSPVYVRVMGVEKTITDPFRFFEENIRWLDFTEDQIIAICGSGWFADPSQSTVFLFERSVPHGALSFGRFFTAKVKGFAGNLIVEVDLYRKKKKLFFGDRVMVRGLAP